jgi:hypothetical protein
MAVQEYLDKHSLSVKIEEGVNEVVKAKPDEPLSFLVTPPTPRDLEHAVSMPQSAPGQKPLLCSLRQLLPNP